METSMERLASGRRINSAADDAAGSAIESRMTAQVRGLNMAIKNASDGISLAQTMEGALIEVEAMAQRSRELAVQAANQTNDADDSVFLDNEYQALAVEIDRIVNDLQFNGFTVWSDGTVDNTNDSNSANFVVYLNEDLSSSLNVTHTAFDTTTLGSGDLDNATNAIAEVAVMDTFLDGIRTARSELGAIMNTLEYSINSMQEIVLNTEAARGRIVDTDFATETASLSRTQILQQAGTAMLAQANASTQNVLSLLK
jgi:flagellin